ncbi:MAG: hypothetical protein K2O17_01645 [Bacteroidaceae bacterium]|nr:hypothetical protein [Bacteroidaceae bacterium]
MNLFRKSQHNIAPLPEEKPTAPEEMTTAKASRQMTAEELAREWWKGKYGESMPDEVTQWFKQLARTEARRQHIAAALLSPQQMARTEDAIRLAETKLRTIEDALQRVHDQKEWLRRYSEKKHELTEHQQRLYEVNKQLSVIAGEEKELNRFETFETIQGLFQRMMVLEKQARTNKQEQSLLARKLEEVKKTVDNGQKRLSQLNDEHAEGKKQMRAVCERLEEANRILGMRVVLDLDEKSSTRLLATIDGLKSTLDKEIAEYGTLLAGLQESITRLCAERQTMEPHQQLIEHGGMVLALLDQLYEMREELVQLSRTQEEGLRRQQEENNMLSRVFTDYQNVEADINSINAELQLHRQQNLGQTGYSLQERTMRLKSRRQMLLSAQSLWNRIQSGYLLIEEKTQTVNRLRLNLGNLRQNIEALENEVIPMRQLCHDKEYTLTLSKSQNVIQLRGDLKEGVSCTVCGATHHPYHSDTMLEQSKLISDLRTDYELQAAELTAKENLLQQIRDELTATTARHEVEEEALSQLRHRQMEDVKEWKVFATLDRTFEECSSSTNLEARTTLLRQLIESTAIDADNAQKELDEHNFHQTRINELVEQLTKKEQQKSDLTVRLNEINTGCQVLARQVERTRQMHVEQEKRYSRLYEKANTLVTLEQWYSDWQKNPEAVRLRIEKMMERWKTLNADIARAQQQQELSETVKQHKKDICVWLETLTLQVRDEMEQRRNLRKEGEKTYESMLGQQEAKAYFKQHIQLLRQIMENEQRQQQETQHDIVCLSEIKGRLQELSEQGQALDRQVSDDRSQLDVWMRQFNANHPPVQYAELERAFASDKDWNELRTQIRNMRIEAMLEQTRVDRLRSEVVALQAEGVRPGHEETDLLESLVSQQKQLEKQRNEVMMQLAAQHITINKHKECTTQLKAEEEELYEQANK